MGTTESPHLLTARALRLLAWIHLIPGLVALITLIVLSIQRQRLPPYPPGLMLGLFAVLVLIPGLMLAIGPALERRAEWARMAGVGLALCSLFSLPVGTLLGAWVLYRLLANWDPEPTVAKQSPGIEPRQQAGRLLRLLGWLHLAAGSAFVLILSSAASSARKPPDFLPGLILVIIFAFIAMPVVVLWIGAAIKRGEEWARPVGMVLASLMLLSIPIGTLVGGYVLYALATRWDASAAPGSPRI